jgi:hypothetical protein
MTSEKFSAPGIIDRNGIADPFKIERGLVGDDDIHRALSFACA